MWKLTVLTEDGKKHDLQLEPSSSVGGLTLNLITNLPETEPWSNFTLFFEDKNKWLNQPRMSLDQCGLFNGSILKFCRTVLETYIILPNFRIKKINVDTCRPTINLLQSVCETIGLRKFEELSFIIIPGREREEEIKSKSKEKNKTESVDYFSKVKCYYELIEKNNSSPIYESHVKIPTHIYEMFPSTNSLSDWCLFHEKWALLSQSLKEQGFKDDDVLYLRFKYSQLSDLNPKIDLVRFNLAFHHAWYSILTQELKCEESELFEMVSMIWTVNLLRDKCLINEADNETVNAVDDVDFALKQLELGLKGNETKKVNPDTIEFFNLKSILPDPHSKSSKMTILDRSWLSIYKDQTDNDKLISQTGNLTGAMIVHLLNFKKSSFKLQLSNVRDKNFKVMKIKLKFNDETVFLNWWAAVRCASRGICGGESILIQEKVFLKSYLNMRKQIYSESNHLPSVYNYGVEDLFPKWILKKPNYTPEQVLEKILDYFPSYYNLSKKEIQQNFIQKWKGLNFCNMICFRVIYDPVFDKNTMTKKKYDLFGISSKFAAKINPANEEIVEKWPLYTLKSWSINWKSNTQVLNLENVRINFVSLTCDVKKIHECIGGNVYLNSRKDPGLPFENSLFNKLTS